MKSPAIEHINFGILAMPGWVGLRLSISLLNDNYYLSGFACYFGFTPHKQLIEQYQGLRLLMNPTF